MRIMKMWEYYKVIKKNSFSGKRFNLIKSCRILKKKINGKIA